MIGCWYAFRLGSNIGSSLVFGSGCILILTDWFQHWALAQLFGCLTAYLAGIFSHFVNYKLIDSILWISGCYRFCGLCFKFGIQDGIGFIDDYLLTVFLLCEIKWSVFFWLDRVYDWSGSSECCTVGTFLVFW